MMVDVYRRPQRRIAAAALAAAVVAATATLSAGPAGATLLFSLTRLSGADRYGTSAVVATTAFSTAPTVILATGSTYPDALAASYLAGSLHAPILLTTPDLPLSAATSAALSALGTKDVIIVGGTSAVSAAEQNQLASTAIGGGGTLSVTRLSGVTRYDTMRAIDEASVTGVGSLQGKKTAFLATGQNFPDALGAAPISYADGFPIVLTTSQTLAPQAASTLETLGIQQVLILGGQSAVSSAVEASVNAMGIPTLQRFPGVDRSATSALLADWAIATLGFKNSDANVVSGDPAFGGADALSTGPLGGSEDPVVTLLTNSITDPGQVVTFMAEHAGTLIRGFAIGGTVALPPGEVSTIVAAGASGSGGSGGSGGSSGGAGGGSGGSGVTGAPALVSAIVLSTTVPALSSGTNAAGTVIQYNFSAPISAPNAAAFKAWPADDGVNAQAGYNAGGGGSGVCGAGAVCTASTSPNSVNVLFAQPALQATSGPDSASSLTLATVASGAVVGTGAGKPNPPGSAAISGSSRVSPTPGATQSPYIVSVGATPRSALLPDESAVDLAFNEATIPQSATTSAGDFDLVFASGVVNTPPTGPVVAGTDNLEEQCTGPAASASTFNTGLTSPGYNPTADLVTIVCPNPGNSGPPLTSAQIAWVVVQPGAIGSNLAGSVGDAVNAVLDSSVTPHASAAPIPRLTAVTLTPGTTGAADVAAFTFDEPVTGTAGTVSTIDTADFDLVQQDGGTAVGPAGDEGGGTCSTLTPTSYPGCQVPSAAGGTVVDLFFPPGTFRAFAIVGGAVRSGAVLTANAPVFSNPDDELSASGAVTLGAGSTNAIQLSGAQLNTALNPFGQPLYTVIYTFTEAVTLPPANVDELHIYDADGTNLECAPGTATIGVGVADNQVTCRTFNQGVSATPATTTQLANAVVATVNFGTVSGNATVGVANEATNTYPSPEGEQSI